MVFTAVPGESAYNPIGAIHGGPVCTLLDTVCGCALHSVLPARRGCTPIDLNVNYLKAVRLESGGLTATGELVKAGRRVGFTTSEVRNVCGAVVATATSSLHVFGLPPLGSGEAAPETGQLTEAAMEGPFGFCQYASHPGQVVALDAFYVGRLKGVGAVWQLTAVDIATRVAVVQLDVGDKSATVTALLLGRLQKALRKRGITLEGVLTDNGPEFVGRAFQTRVGEMGLHHHRIPPRSPNHNAVCERFHGTVLEEFYRPHVHRGRVEDVALLRPVAAGLGHRLQQRASEPR